MKQLFVFAVILLSASYLYSQDVITLRTGEIINAKVAEVGISEVRYFKASNVDGPIYVVGKADISQIVYNNGNRDVFNTTTQQSTTVIVQQTTPQTMYIQQPVRRRNFWNSGLWYPVVYTHIDFRHYGGYFYSGYHGHH